MFADRPEGTGGQRPGLLGLIAQESGESDGQRLGRARPDRAGVGRGGQPLDRRRPHARPRLLQGAGQGPDDRASRAGIPGPYRDRRGLPERSGRHGGDRLILVPQPGGQGGDRHPEVFRRDGPELPSGFPAAVGVALPDLSRPAVHRGHGVEYDARRPEDRAAGPDEQ
jgi:hypothetical protein